MTLTAEQVAGWPSAPLAEAARQARDNSRSLRTEIAAAREKFRQLTTWHGATHAAASRRIGEEVDHVEEVSRVLAAFADAAEAAGRDLASGRDQVMRLMLVHNGFQIDGSPRGVDSPVGDDHRDAEQGQRVAAALAELDETDRRHATTLARFANDLTAMTHGHAGVATPEGERDPDGVVNRLIAMTPNQRRALLSRWSEGDLSRLVAANPQVLGTLDGVPLPTRIAANRRSIEEALESEIRRGAGEGPRARQLRGMLALVPDPHDPHRLVPRQFITFANTKTGRSIEMLGSVTARSTGAAVYVPGTGTAMDSSESNRKAAWNFANRSGAPVFLYMDGRFPPDLAHAVSPDYATEMAPTLVGFSRALNAELAEIAPGAAITYIGHSYGGAVVGTAEQLGLSADRVVYASASGSGVLPGGASAWTNPTGVQHFSMTAPGDPIHAFQSTGRHGQDPDTVAGVVQLDTGTYSDGRQVEGRDGHGAYFNDPGSGAFANIVAVIRGEPVIAVAP